MHKVHRLSIFSQSYSVAAFVSYFLGAVVPLGALAYLAHRYVIPEMADLQQALALVALSFSIAMLSLGAFLLLRRSMAQSVARMAKDNHNLQVILEAARGLSLAPHRADAAEMIAICARTLTSAEAAFVLVPEKTAQGSVLSIIGEAGEDAGGAYDKHRSALEEAARLTIESGRPVLRGELRETGDGGDGGDGAVCSVPVDAGRPDGGVIALVGDAEEDIDSLSTLAALGAVALRNSELQDMQRHFFVQLTDILVSALDQQLGYHEGHSRRVAHLANRIGRELGFDDERLQRLHFAALLHDIGMLKIPSDQHGDKSIARKHPANGHRMLSAIRLWEDLAPFVLYHHEWFNGEGYPEGLSGEAIPLEARVIGLAEAVDTMISPTSYKEAVSIDEMVGRVDAASGAQFDPQIARVFIKLMRDGAIELN